MRSAASKIRGQLLRSRICLRRWPVALLLIASMNLPATRCCWSHAGPPNEATPQYRSHLPNLLALLAAPRTLPLFHWRNRQDLSSPKTDPQRPPSAALPEVIDTSVAFVGWNGEIPILRQEEGLSDGSTRTSFQSLNPDGSLTNLDPKSWQGIQKGSPVRNPPGLRAGTILVERHAAVVDDPQVVLKIDVNEKQMDSLRQALRDWNDGKRDASQGFPPVQASLRIDMSWRGQQPRVLWKNSATLGVVAGEAGFEFTEPSLELAVLSPARKVLLVEISLGADNTERHLIVIPENP